MANLDPRCFLTHSTRPGPPGGHRGLSKGVCRSIFGGIPGLGDAPGLPKLPHHLVRAEPTHRPQTQMVGVAQADATAQRVQLFRRDALHGGLRAHWHEYWSGHPPVRQPQLACPCPGAVALGHQPQDPRGRLQGSRTSCRHLACQNHVGNETPWTAPYCLASREANCAP